MRGASNHSLQQAADIALSMQRLRLRRYLGTLATIGSTAPFIGLFGTVLGIMQAFYGMSQGGGLSGERMAAGISEALSATALGLLVAVPSVIAYNYFLGRVQGLLLHVQGHVARLVPMLHGAPSGMNGMRSERERVEA
jgi:biopolymer transport protein TolQ